MLQDRNSTAHVYDEEAAMELVQKILHVYIPAFLDLQKNIENHYRDNPEVWREPQR